MKYVVISKKQCAILMKIIFQKAELDNKKISGGQDKEIIECADEIIVSNST